MLVQKKLIGCVLAGILMISSAFMLQKEKPTLFVIGDSTVKNGQGKGGGQMWGWGDFIGQYFDQGKINIQNRALGGTSSRTFQTRGLWDSVLVKIKPGDFVLLQFGHNDGGQLDDTARARGTIKGIGMESKDIYNPILKKNETVYTYGWYLRKFIADAKAKGAVTFVCSPIPRNNFKEGKVVRSDDSYGLWAKQAAQSEGAYFIDLNNIIADQYDQLGEKVVAGYFQGDHTHTSGAGAKVNAASVVTGLRTLKKNPLNKYLLKP